MYHHTIEHIIETKPIIGLILGILFVSIIFSIGFLFTAFNFNITVRIILSTILLVIYCVGMPFSVGMIIFSVLHLVSYYKNRDALLDSLIEQDRQNREAK